ncbi:hypothetical protein TRIUR3_23829 [Triticum urartu]|uniref:Uncharacterized protein n=2 Tax=Triticum urartu TaxID=4572 RepID=M8A7W0_TRIUA|nr:hypothetical protein TRIUR3_23829 [Triticum urartu]
MPKLSPIRSQDGAIFSPWEVKRLEMLLALEGISEQALFARTRTQQRHKASIFMRRRCAAGRGGAASACAGARSQCAGARSALWRGVKEALKRSPSGAGAGVKTAAWGAGARAGGVGAASGRRRDEELEPHLDAAMSWTSPDHDDPDALSKHLLNQMQAAAQVEEMNLGSCRAQQQLEEEPRPGRARARRSSWTWERRSVWAGGGGAWT